MKESCETCRFSWQDTREYADSDYRYCRRRPPVVMGKCVDFPRLRKEQWCGEYEAKPAEDTPK